MGGVGPGVRGSIRARELRVRNERYLARARIYVGSSDASEPRVLGDAVMRRVSQLMAGVLSESHVSIEDGSGDPFSVHKGEAEVVATIQRYVKIARDLVAMQRDMQVDVMGLFREAAERMSPSDRAEFTKLFESKVSGHDFRGYAAEAEAVERIREFGVAAGSSSGGIDSAKSEKPDGE